MSGGSGAWVATPSPEGEQRSTTVTLILLAGVVVGVTVLGPGVAVAGGMTLWAATVASNCDGGTEASMQECVACPLGVVVGAGVVSFFICSI